MCLVSGYRTQFICPTHTPEARPEDVDVPEDDPGDGEDAHAVEAAHVGGTPVQLRHLLPVGDHREAAEKLLLHLCRDRQKIGTFGCGEKGPWFVQFIPVVQTE